MRRWPLSLARLLFAKPPAKRRRRKCAPPLRLRVEELESRLTPSTTLILAETGPATTTAGADIVYNVSLSNTGANAATSVSLTASLPLGTTFVSQTQTGGPAFSLSHSGGTATDTIASFAAGSTATFQVIALVPSTTSNNTSLTALSSVTTSTSLNPGSVIGANVATKAYTFGPVSLTNPGSHSNAEGASVSVSLSASDSSGGTLHYAAANLPPGLAINPSSGAITGTVGLGAAAASPYSTTVTASDGAWSAQQTFTWTITSPITVTNPGTQTSAEGGTVSLSISASGGGTKAYAAVGLPPGLSINTGTGAITGTVGVGAAAGGPYSVTVTAADGTYSASQTFPWNVTSAVTMAAIPDQTSNEGDTISLSVSASGGTLAYTATGLPPGLKISTSTGAITGTMAAGAAAGGPYTVTVSAGDGTYSASQTFTWNVTDPVTITAPADQANNQGDSVSLSVSAADSSSGTLTYGAVGLPAGLSINASTGVLSGTVSASAAVGASTVTLLAGDGTYSAATTFTWTVNSPISITAIADQSNSQGDSASLSVSASGSGTLTYSATGLPPGVSINSSTGAISGTITAAGSFAPTVTVGNGTYSASVGFNWAVGGAISVTDPGPQTFNAGDAVSLPVSASGGGTLSYSATGLPSGLSINSGSGLISGTISSSLSAGLYSSTASVTDGTNTTKLTIDWTIYPASTVVLTNPGPLSGAEGDTVSRSLSASYSGSGTLKYAATGLPPGLALNPSTGAITGTLAAGASAFSPYTVTVTATDGTAGDSQTFTWTVGSSVPLGGVSNQSSAEGDSVSLSVSVYYAGGPLTYSAVGLPPGLTIGASSGTISGTVAGGAGALSPYTVTVQAAYAPYTTEETFTWTVSSPITITTPADQTNSEGDSVSLSISASGGGTKTYSATGLPPGLKINTGTGAITGTVAVGAAANGPYSVTVVAEDGTSSSSASFTWNVNSPVTITTPADQTSSEGASVSLSISASDSTSGTLRYAAVGLPPGLVISATTGAISGTVSVGDAANGPYTVTIGAGDGTYSAQTSFTWDVSSPITVVTPPDQTNSAGQSASLAIQASGSGTLTYSATGLPNGLSINSSTGVISGTLSAGGLFQPTVTVSNGTYSNSAQFSWAVSSPIFVTDPGDQANNIGNSVSLAVQATDSAGGTLSYSASGLPTGLSINSSSGVISGTVGSGASTTTPYTPTVTVTDGTRTAVDTFTWTISQAGPVVVTSPGNQTNAVGDMVALQTVASDTNHASLIYSVSGLPAGLYLNPTTGMIFGTVASGANAGSPYSVTVTAKDTSSSTASQTFSWTINAAGTVTMTNPGDQTSTEGGSVSLSISASDSSSGTLRYVAFGLPAGLSIDTSTGAISGTVAIGDSSNSPYPVTVVANDGTYSASQSFNWTVNGAVTIAMPADQTNSEGDTVSLSISASGGGTKAYAALGLPPGLKINPSTGAITGTVAVGAAADGPYSVTVIAADGTYSALTTFTWNVASPITITPPDDQSNSEGDSVSLSFSVSDSHTGTLVYSALGLPPGISINPSTGAISGTVAVAASTIGSYFPTVVVNDGTYTSSTSFEWDVSGPILITDPGDQASVVGDTVSLQIGAADSSSGTLTYAASGLPDGLSISTSTGLISGTISSGATAIGTYTTTITVGDGTYSAVDSFTWTVSAAGTITMATPSNQTNTEGDTGSLSLSASGGGTKKYFAVGLPAGLQINPSTGAITGTVALGDAAYGPYTVTVMATDGTYSAEETFTWAVNGPVTLSAVSDQTTAEGDTVSLSISASGGGTLKYGAVGLPAGLKINTGMGAITGTVAIGTAASGSYTVTVTAGDGTYSASRMFTWTLSGPITLTQPADQINTEGDTVSVSISASGGGTKKYSATGLPAGLKINTGTGAITGTVAVGDSANGPHTVTITASDGTYNTSVTFNWTINSPISITAPGTQNFSASNSVNFQVRASGSGTLTFLAFGLPAGLTINAATGLISGVISSAGDAAGFVNTLVEVANGSSSAVQSLNWQITAPPLGLVTTLFQAQAEKHGLIVMDVDGKGPEKLTGDDKSYENTQQLYKDIVKPFDKDVRPLVSDIVFAMVQSKVEKKTYNFATVEDLQNAIRFRILVIKVARLLDSKKEPIVRPGLKFQQFNRDGILIESPLTASTDPLWVKTNPIPLADGTKASGIQAKTGVTEYAAMEKLYTDSLGTSFDCATSIGLALQFAAFNLVGAGLMTKDQFNQRFRGPGNNLKIVGIIGTKDLTSDQAAYDKDVGDAETAIGKGNAPPKQADLIPGDIREFYNPDGKNNFQRENTIYLGQDAAGDDQYFAWGLGILKPADVIKKLTDIAKTTNPRARTAVAVPISLSPVFPKPKER